MTNDANYGINSLAGKRGLIPTRVTIKDFMSHHDTTLDFGDFTVIHSQKNGVGKTSILEALMFAFTGQTLRTMSNLKVQDVIRRSANSTTIKVDGIFKRATDVAPASFFLERSRSKRGTELKLRLGMQEVADPKEFIEDEIEAKAFSVITYINGHDIFQLFKGTPKETASLLDKLFGIDVLERTRDALGTISIEREINAINEQVSNVRRLQSMASNYNAARSELEKTNRGIEAISQKINQLNGELNGTTVVEQRAKDAIRRVQDRKDRVKELVTKVIMLRDRNVTLDHNITGENTKAKGVDDIVNDLNRTFQGRTSKDIIDENNARKEGLLRTLQSEEAVPTVVDLLLEALQQNANTSCPVCGKRSTEAEVKTQKEAFFGIHQERRDHLAHLNNEIMNLVAVDQRIQKLTAKKTAILEDITKMTREKETNERHIEEIQNMISELQALEDISEQERILEERKSVAISGQLTELNREKNDLERRRNELSEGANTALELSELPRIDQLEATKAKKVALVEKFKRWKATLSESLKVVRERTLSRINNIINEYLGIFEQTVVKSVSMEVTRSPYRDEIKYQYNIVVRDAQNRSLPFDSLSTGQKASVLLSLVLSINDVSANAFPLVLFDEIQACGLDDDGIRTVVSMLATLSTVRNIVVTSRSEEFVRYIETELNRTNEEGVRVHDISVKIYECKSEVSDRGTPTSIVARYNGN